MALNAFYGDPALLSAATKTLTDDDRTLRAYLSHRQALVNYASGITGDKGAAEDVVQDAWLKVGQADSRQIVEKPLSYLFKAVRNLAIDGRRRLARDQKHTGASMELATLVAPDETPSVERALMAEEELAAVREVIAKLPDNQRIAIEMYRLGDCKLRDIAERLGVSVAYAHVLLSEGLVRCDRARARGRQKK